jgi:hypothetical protein
MDRALTIRTEWEAILVEQAWALARASETLSDAAAGRVLAVSVSAAIRLCRASEASPQRQAESAERGAPGAGLPLWRTSPRQGRVAGGCRWSGPHPARRSIGPYTAA